MQPKLRHYCFVMQLVVVSLLVVIPVGLAYILEVMPCCLQSHVNVQGIRVTHCEGLGGGVVWGGLQLRVTFS